MQFYLSIRRRRIVLACQPGDKKRNIETTTALITSQEFYTLIVQKEGSIIDSSAIPQFTLNLIAASKVLVSDSLLSTRGTKRFTFTDNSSVSFSNVIFQNNPLGECCSLGFKATLNREEMKKSGSRQITEIEIPELKLRTRFDVKRQTKLQKAINCIILKQEYRAAAQKV